MNFTGFRGVSLTPQCSYNDDNNYEDINIYIPEPYEDCLGAWSNKELIDKDLYRVCNSSSCEYIIKIIPIIEGYIENISKSIFLQKISSQYDLAPKIHQLIVTENKIMIVMDYVDILDIKNIESIEQLEDITKKICQLLNKLHKISICYESSQYALKNKNLMSFDFTKSTDDLSFKLNDFKILDDLLKQNKHYSENIKKIIDGAIYNDMPTNIRYMNGTNEAGKLLGINTKNMEFMNSLEGLEADVLSGASMDSKDSKALSIIPSIRIWIGTREISEKDLTNYKKSIQLLEDDNWNHHLFLLGLTDESETVKKIKNWNQKVTFHYKDEFLSIFDEQGIKKLFLWLINEQMFAFASNIARQVLLVKYGGLYCDIGSLILDSNIGQYIRSHELILCIRHDETIPYYQVRVDNHFISTNSPNNLVLKATLVLMQPLASFFIKNIDPIGLVGAPFTYTSLRTWHIILSSLELHIKDLPFFVESVHYKHNGSKSWLAKERSLTMQVLAGNGNGNGNDDIQSTERIEKWIKLLKTEMDRRKILHKIIKS